MQRGQTSLPPNADADCQRPDNRFGPPPVAERDSNGGTTTLLNYFVAGGLERFDWIDLFPHHGCRPARAGLPRSNRRPRLSETALQN